MARRKSINDIEEQISRIQMAAINGMSRDFLHGRGGTARDRQLEQRERDVINIGERYLSNIERTAQYKRDKAASDKAWSAYDGGPGQRKQARAAVNADQRLDNRKYSQQAYLGLAAG